MPADAATTVQLATGTFVVCTAAGHVTVVKPLPEVGPAAAQLATGTLRVLVVPQVLVV